MTKAVESPHHHGDTLKSFQALHPESKTQVQSFRSLGKLYVPKTELHHGNRFSLGMPQALCHWF
jgi:hypothetical protein